MPKTKCYELRVSVRKWFRSKFRKPRRVGIQTVSVTKPQDILERKESVSTFDSESKGEWKSYSEKVSQSSLKSFHEEDYERQFTSVLRLPLNCRALLYDLLDYEDILQMRLVCKQFLYELHYFRGVKVQLDDTIYEYDWFRNLGVGSLIVRHYKENKPIKALLKIPSLLKTVLVTGSIAPQNFNALVENCPNILNFGVEMSPFSIRYGFRSFDYPCHTPRKLQSLRITAFMYDHGDALRAFENVQPILKSVRTSTLRNFIYQICMIDTQDVSGFHSEALRLIRGHASSLKTIHIVIKQVFSSASPSEHQPLLAGDPEGEMPNTEMDEMRLTLDRHVSDWQSVLLSSCRIANLELNLRNCTWSSLGSIFLRNEQSLRNLQIYRLNTRESRTIFPIDVSLLRNCSFLQKLTLHHQPHSPAFMPKITKTVYLPLTLQEVELSRFCLKQHQILFLLIRLPLVKKISLAHWIDIGTDLTEVLSIIAIVIKFNISTVENIVILDSKNKFLPHERALTKIANFLDQDASIRTTETSRERSITIRVKQ